MEEIQIVLRTEEELWELFDKTLDHIMLDRLYPYARQDWQKGSLKMGNGVNLEDVEFRYLSCDLRTNLKGLKSILKLPVYGLRVFQSSKPWPSSLILNRLNEGSVDKVLAMNGVRHFFALSYEFVTIRSFDPEFIARIKHNFESCPK